MKKSVHIHMCPAGKIVTIIYTGADAGFAQRSSASASLIARWRYQLKPAYPYLAKALEGGAHLAQCDEPHPARNTPTGHTAPAPHYFVLSP